MKSCFALRFFVHIFSVAVLSALFSLLLVRQGSGSLPDFIIITVLILFLAASSAFVISRNLKRRIENLSGFAASLGAGNFDRMLSPANDEVGSLESAMLDMSSSLKSLIERLEDEKGQREAVLASMGEGVIVADGQGKITLANKKAKELFRGRVEGQKVSELSRDPGLLDLMERIRGSWSSVSGEIVLGGPKEGVFLVTVAPLIRQMKVHGSVIVFHDITMIKKLENMRKDFVANVSHELKTPLTSIRGFAETLADGGIDDRENALKFVGTIKRNSERLSRLVEDLLTLSNIELGKVSFDIRRVDLADSFNSVVNTLRLKADEKGLELNVCVGEGIRVSADRDRLEQILINLVDNGIKFTDSGSVILSGVREGGRVRISVKDTGTGIPGKSLPRIGERFYRVDPARSRELGGTGLGLAIVKHLVTSMKGDFSVESKAGEGTTVGFTLPAA